MKLEIKRRALAALILPGALWLLLAGCSQPNAEEPKPVTSPEQGSPAANAPQPAQPKSD